MELVFILHVLIKIAFLAGNGMGGKPLLEGGILWREVAWPASCILVKQAKILKTCNHKNQAKYFCNMSYNEERTDEKKPVWKRRVIHAQRERERLRARENKENLS